MPDKARELTFYLTGPSFLAMKDLNHVTVRYKPLTLLSPC